ncbi:MAG: hypothetical protein AAGA46_00545 [Cyanobacteria bacterium P01_F01_bin.13]
MDKIQLNMLSTILSLVLAFTLPSFDTDGPGYNAFIQSIYDGDTLTVVFSPDPITGGWVQEKIRLYDVANGRGVNTPEVRGPERPRGIISKLWVQEQIAASPEERLITEGDRGKYGRLLGDISYRCHPIAHPKDWCSLANRLVDGGLAEVKEY